MATREVLTLQFGNYSNYIGSHLWNIQESGFSYDPTDEPTEISNEVFYREGVNLNRQTTYTPRLLLVDLDGSLKHLPREGELYGNNFKRASDNGTSDTEDQVKKLKEDLPEEYVELKEEPVASKHEFQKDLDNPEVNVYERNYNLASNVESWADFLYARFHPRTLNIIKQYKYQPDKQSFDTFSCGAHLWRTEQFEDDFSDKIRQYVEECDYLQGFQIIFDCFNGHSGLATKCMEHLSDEYAKSNFAIPVYSPHNTHFENADDAMSDSIRVVNSALAFHQLTEHASLILPLSTQDRVWRQLGSARSLPGLQYQSNNLYQTSAILAAYLDTISLRFRLKNAPSSNTLAGFCADLTNYGRKLTAAAFALPFTMHQDIDLIDCLDRWEGPLFTQLTPNCKIGSEYIIQSLCVRGIPRSRLKRPFERAQQQMHMTAYKCESVSEMLQLYLQCTNHASMAHVTATSVAMPTRLPFPCEMFDNTLSTTGFVLPSAAKRAPDEKIVSVPTLASIQSSSSLGDTLETLHREANRIKIAKLHRFKVAGLEQDDYSEALENLLLFKDNYEDNYEL